MRISVFAMAVGASMVAYSAQAVHLKKAGPVYDEDYMDQLALAELDGDYDYDCECDELGQSDAYAYSVADNCMYELGDEPLDDDDMLAETEQAGMQDMSAINLIDNERNMHMIPAPPQPQPMQ